MNSSSKRILTLLTIVIIASGCGGNTNNNEGPSTSPIEVNSFEIIPNDQILSGQPITAQMTLENTGTNDATNVAAKLFGPAWLNAKSPEKRTLDFGTLEASSETSFPVSERTDFNAPNVEKGRTSNYNINAQILYNYETDASTDFKFVSRERFRNQGYSTGEADIENSPGPIQLGIRGNTPIRYDASDTSGSTPTEEICVTVKNKGTGTPFSGSIESVLSSGSISDSNENKVTLSVTGGSGISVSLAKGESNTVDLIDGKRGWSCYKISANTGSNAETTLNLEITASYNYLKETSTGISVKGVEN